MSTKITYLTRHILSHALHICGFVKYRRVRGNSLTKRPEKHSFDMNMNEFPSLGDSTPAERVVNSSYGPGWLTPLVTNFVFTKTSLLRKRAFVRMRAPSCMQEFVVLYLTFAIIHSLQRGGRSTSISAARIVFQHCQVQAAGRGIVLHLAMRLPNSRSLPLGNLARLLPSRRPTSTGFWDCST